MSTPAAFPPTQQNFSAASSWLSSTPAAASLPNETKLKLYGLYKSITSGEPTGGRPSIFYPTPRAKYDAWTNIHRQYHASSDGTEDARRAYIDVAVQVGWKGEGLEAEEEEIDFDEPEPTAAPTTSGEKKGGGMGPRVSVMAQESTLEETAGAEGDDRAAGRIHDAVIDDDLASVKRILRSDPASIDSKDGNGNTPLHLAADRGHLAILQTLLASGADTSQKDEDGQTPLDVAVMLERNDMIPMLQ